MRDDWLPVLQRAIDHADGRWSIEQVLSDVSACRVHVWMVSRETKLVGVFTTRVVDGPARWVLLDCCAGDDLAGWIGAALAAVESWARGVGAAQIVAEGRLGWQKAMRPYGYAPTLITCVKHLETLN